MEFILLTHFKWDVYSTLSHDLGKIFDNSRIKSAHAMNPPTRESSFSCVGSKLKILKVSPLLFIFNLSAEIKNQAAGKIRCFFDCLLTGESVWRHRDLSVTSSWPHRDVIITVFLRNNAFRERVFNLFEAYSSHCRYLLCFNKILLFIWCRVTWLCQTGTKI